MTGPRPIARMLPEIAGKVLGKKGLGFGVLITEWATIVGPEIAQRVSPVKLAFPSGRRQGATLHLKTTGAFAVELQHTAPLLIERVNGVLGYRAVESLKVIQAAPARKAASVATRPLAPTEAARLEERVGGIENAELRDALAALGTAVLAGRR